MEIFSEVIVGNTIKKQPTEKREYNGEVFVRPKLAPNTMRWGISDTTAAIAAVWRRWAATDFEYLVMVWSDDSLQPLAWSASSIEDAANFMSAAHRQLRVIDWALHGDETIREYFRNVWRLADQRESEP